MTLLSTHLENIISILGIKLNYLSQESAWKTHVWNKGREPGKNKKPQRKFHFKQIAR